MADQATIGVAYAGNPQVEVEMTCEIGAPKPYLDGASNRCTSVRPNRKQRRLYKADAPDQV